MRRSFKRHVGLNGVYNGDSEFMAGESIMFSGPADKIPAGYLIEDGAEVGRMAYATLFAAIGTTYGAGDGATTFNLPDSRAQVWRGLDLGRGVDVGRVQGSAQGDAMRAFVARVDSLGLTGTSAFSVDSVASGAARIVPKGENKSVVANSAGNYPAGYLEIGPAIAGLPTAGENRMRNIAKIPLIKY